MSAARSTSADPDAAVGPPAGGSPMTPFATAVAAVAIFKITAALIFAAVIPFLAAQPGATFPAAIASLQLLAFGITGTGLLVAHDRDRRTASLGVSLLCVAAAFATHIYRQLAGHLPALGVLSNVHPDALLPYFLGTFIERFPGRRRGAAGVALHWLVRAAGVAGVALLALNALHEPLGQHYWPVLSATFLRVNTGVPYWWVVFGLFVPLVAFGFVPGDVREAERRRARRFWGWFVFCFAPIPLSIIFSSLPETRVTFDRWLHAGLIFVPEAMLAMLPIAIARAVVVDRILPMRVVARKAVQYVFARATIAAAAIVPLAILAVQIFLRRDERVSDAFAGSAITLLVVAAVSGLAVFWRENLLRVVDRWFFRERYDLANAFIQLSAGVRRSRAIDELVARLTSGIDLAMRPVATTVLVRSQDTNAFVSVFGSADPLPQSSILADALAQSPSPIDAAATPGRLSPLRWLPIEERQWLVDSAAHLLVPLRTSDGDLVGIVALSERRSDLPYDDEDRRWLMAVADAAALTIETHAYRSASLGGSATDAWRVGAVNQHLAAAECAACGAMHEPRTATCTACAAPLSNAHVPLVLFGKFKFDRRVGQGGMGVVYRATDLTLDRAVAVKTLPGTSPEHADRLRVEARAMAAVTHRHLAVIYGAESWRSRPMLICEFMERGTLADRLAGGAMPIEDAVALGIALAEGLDVIHANGLLHRDIKPSNIGFDKHNVPKLLDFGLVHIFAQPADDGGAMSAHADPGTTSLTSSLIGTPLYLSPEATRGGAPSPLFDLWSLNVLLYEAIAGTHPFRGRGVADTLSAIRRAELPALDELRSAGNARAASYFITALARDPSKRHQTAADVAVALRALLG